MGMPPSYRGPNPPVTGATPRCYVGENRAVAALPAVARFDNTRAGGPGLAFAAPVATLVARDTADVVDALEAADAAAAAGSWVAGYVAYEAAAAFDPALASGRHVVRDELPLAWFAVFDEPFEAPPLERAPPGRPGYELAAWRADCDRDEYRDKVGRVRDHIAAGDTYQVNLTARLRSRLTGDPRALYRDLALAQAGDHCAFLDTGRFVVASASPELFFDWRGDRILTRPMKGTGPRGRWVDEDRALGQRLANSEKDRAENVMIVDLLRNDIGRIARWGTVRVEELFALERYETLWQLTSSISGSPPLGATLVDVFGALFPSGSVTGAPKRRTMELIAALEDAPRGVYCGAIGLLAPPGWAFRARFSVAIRTAVVDREDDGVVYGAGGGITWDSDPDAEHAELCAKAAILAGPREECELVETMGFWPETGVRNLAEHLERLAGSAAYFGFPCDAGAVREAIAAATAAAGAARLRVRLGRTGEVHVDRGPLPEPTEGPVRLAVDRVPVDPSSIWRYHKTTRRSDYEAAAARHPGADDVVLVNDRGRVTETTIANLAVFVDGRWCTPPVDSGCLPGVERRRLLESGRLVERDLSRDDLVAAEALAVVSSLRGWRPARLVDDAGAPPVAPTQLSATAPG
jgi:para-aminobenzoate synthetase / 4-amino-4-deoxychorismate lyase